MLAQPHACLLEQDVDGVHVLDICVGNNIQRGKTQSIKYKRDWLLFIELEPRLICSSNVCETRVLES